MNNENFEIRVKKISPEQRKMVEIQCHKMDDDVKEIVDFIKTRQGQLTGMVNDRQYAFSISEVYYIEAVDNKVFIYCKNQVYETKQKLYELEEFLQKKQFIRVSKSILLNLMKIESIRPALNGRFLACLQNQEEIIISRKYVPAFKKTIRGGDQDE